MDELDNGGRNAKDARGMSKGVRRVQGGAGV